MDDIHDRSISRTARHRYASTRHPAASRPQPAASTTPSPKRPHSTKTYWLVRTIGKTASAKLRRRSLKHTYFYKSLLRSRLYQAFSLLNCILLLVSMVGTVMEPFLQKKPYRLTTEARALLPKQNPNFAPLLNFDEKQQKFLYNAGYNGSTNADSAASSTGTPRFNASFAKSGNNTVTVTDPLNGTNFSLTPKFSASLARQDQNQLVYPLADHDGYLVYTARQASVKEDVVLERYGKDKLELTYELGLESGLEARLETDGSVGVYGSSLPINGNVSTATDADAALLQKARQNASKDKLLFTIPAPVVIGPQKKVSTAKSHFELKGTTLKVVTEGLKKATYPLSIDPTVYIETAAKLMRGNNETNIDFDVDNELIQKSQTTGARIDSWSSTTNLSSAVYGQGTAVAGGYIYSVGGVGSGTVTTSTYSTAGSSTYNVPAGVNFITVKIWGGGGSGGNGSGGSGSGGAGGGGGYAKAVISVTPGEALNVTVGSGGADTGTASSGGGRGGGFSTLQRSSTHLVQAGGGGGGGGSRGSSTGNGGAGGAGGGASGENGSNASNGGTRGTGGTTSAGGTGGTSGGVAGAANAGGNGSGFGGTCGSATGTGGNGGFGAGGGGGTDASTCANGGGGGGGRFGGGGGGSNTTNNRGGGGGGGGSSLINATGLVAGTDVQTVGTGATPGNDTDTDRGGSADGGTGGTSTSGGTAGDDGRVVISYSAAGSVTSSLYWAKFNTVTNAIDSPNPGNGACSGWCNNSAYNLPAALQDLSLVAYNGFLYAIGGANSGGTPQTSVYIAKLGANGEPQLWHPSGGTPVFWYTDTALSNARSRFAAVAYNNRMYLLGGLTTSSTVLSSNTVQYADIRPTGTLTSFTTTGMQALTGTGGGNRYGITAHIYNDVIYVIGGSTTLGGAPVTNVDYAKLNTDGTMNSWVSTSALLSGRITVGGSYSTVFGGYLYANGGCATVNSSGYCTAVSSGVELTSINADGSLAGWNTILNLANDRFAHTTIAWQGGLYRLGGCRSQDPTTGACTNTVIDVDYGVINPEGEASTVADSVGSGTAPCSGSNPYGCDLPGTSVIGNVLNGSAILNGYLYIWGGCSNASSGCGTVSRSVAYTSVGSDGLLTKPASCGTWTAVDSYCYNTTSLPGSVGAPGSTVFNGILYSIGGFTASGMVGNIYYATPNANGTITSWSTTGLAGIGATSVSYPYTFARANPGSAGSTPGNLYILGGCVGATGIGCPTTGGYTEDVFKCNLNTTGVPSACSTTGQMQIGTVSGAASAGLGAMAGTIYANYIYLMGGLAEGATDLKTTRYAKIDNSNNIVDVSTGLSGGSWIESNNQTFFGRRRGSGFGYNGYLYVVGGYDGASGGGGVLADIEYAKINVSDGSIEPWVVSSVNINQRWGLTLRVSNSYAYVIGGCISGAAPTCDAGGQTNSIQTFQVYNNDSGAVQSYTPSSNNFASSTDRWGSSATILNGYIYVGGGCTSATDCTTATGDVEYAPINASDGSIGSWSAATKGIGDSGSGAQLRAWGKLVTAGGYLYYLGGQTSTSTDERSEIYYVQPGGAGNITNNWGTATKAIGDTGSGGQARTKFGAAVWDNRIYVVGGLDGSAAATNTVFVSPQLNSGGNISSNWGSSTAFSVARYGLAVTAYANNLYILGGIDASGNYLNDVQFATLGYKTGTISQSGTTLTGSGTTWTSSMVGNGVQYPDGSRSTITGFSSTTSLAVSASKTVSAGTIYTIQDGSITSWAYSTGIPTKIAQAEAFGANGYIYLVGGRTATSSCSPKTQVAPVSANTSIATGNNPTGVGDWFETNVKYAGGRYGAAVAYAGGKLYVMGGGCTRPQSGTYTTGTITQSGTTVTGAGGASFSDDLIGGTITYLDASTATVVTVNSSTSLTVSVSKTIGTGQTYSIAVPRNSYGGVKSQPQIAKYSRMIDTDTDVFPNSWLMNGLDNSVGARWQTRYRSMHDINPLVVGGTDSVVYSTGTITQSGTTVTGSGTNWTSGMVGGTIVYADASTATISSVNTGAQTMVVSVSKSIASAQTYKIYTLQQNPSEDCGTSASMATMTSWGQETNFGDVTLGTVNTYTPKDSSGGNINCARYYYFFMSIDASQTYGYPEDVTRGPTLADLSLFYTSDPSKRLIHGKTFIGGEQQPLNTPCRQSSGQANCPLP